MKQIGMALSLLVLAAAVAAQAPRRQAATVGERMLALGLASVNETGETVPAPREQVVAWIADMTNNIAELRQKVARMEAARDWVQTEVLPRYPVPTATPTPTATASPSPTPNP
jgi:hypothetical protein